MSWLSLWAALAWVAGAAKYDYNYAGDVGPLDWGDVDANCASKVRQSPIDLEAFRSHIFLNMEDLHLNGYDTPISGLKMKNNGHTVVAGLDEELLKGNIGMTGGDFGPDGYWLHSFHFHWAGEDHKGSEHTLGGVSYPLELHFVHVHHGIKDIFKALADPDGLAALGVFFRLVDDHDPASQSRRSLPLDPFMSAWEAAKDGKGANGTIGAFKLSDLVPANRQSFFRYKGSLTTPPCSEAVTWTVMSEPLLVSKAQMAALRAVKLPRADGGFDTENFRPVQPLGGRTLYLRSNQIKIFDAAASADKPLAIGLLGAICCLLTFLIGQP